MRLTLAVRRRGGDAEATVDVLLRATGLPDDVREAAGAVRRDRDRAGEAGRVIGWFGGVAIGRAALLEGFWARAASDQGRGRAPMSVHSPTTRWLAPA
jgi:hypothetical protein